jgi:tocopherol O-methyltransferase
MITCATVRRRSIRWHYDLLAPFYRLLWGPHLHHGLWPEGHPLADVLAAQRRLVALLAAHAGIGPGQEVLDVGCGLGGTCRELARRHGCRVTGLTLSPVQCAWACWEARRVGLGGRNRFRCADAETVALTDAAFDVVWNVECSEHLFDKPGFFRRAAGWLRPGGRLALCAWLAGDGPDAGPVAARVCADFLCPSLGTAADYQGWLADANLRPVHFADLTSLVVPTWDVCLRRVRRTGLNHLAWLLGGETGRFVRAFEVLGTAYRTGAMRYGLFVHQR